MSLLAQQQIQRNGFSKDFGQIAQILKLIALILAKNRQIALILTRSR